MSQHNWISGLDDALIDMAIIEGDYWLDQELRWIVTHGRHPQNFALHDAPEFSVAAAIRYIEHVKKDEEYEDYDRNGESTETYNFSTSVYGRGGWNRWFFTDKGGIIFSAYHSTKDNQQIARELNFEVS